MPTLRFNAEEIDLFGDASHDRNPLHVSATYARRTPFGEPVVFGILGVLKALGAVADRRVEGLESATILFRNPLFKGVDYRLTIEPGKSGQVKAAIHDAGRAMMTATFAFRDAPGAVGSTESTAAREVAATWTESDFRPGLEAIGTYAPAPDALHKLLARCHLTEIGNAASPVAALLLASYLVGMELPGERALFSRLKVRFSPTPTQTPGPIAYLAEVTSYDERFGMLETSVSLTAGGVSFAEFEISSVVRPSPPVLDLRAIASALPPSEVLRGKSALVIGGSRGLGAALVAALASQGCAVYLNYLSSVREAESLARSLPEGFGRVTPVRGDASDPAWCRRLQAELTETGGVDLLVCNAVPPLRALRFGLDSLDRIRKSLDTSFTLTAGPLAAFAPDLEAKGGMVAIISSIVAAEDFAEFPADLHDYVAAKAGIEGFCRSLSAMSERTKFLVARPPRLLTDLTNNATGNTGSLAVEIATAAIVERLISPDLGRYVVIDEFATP